MFLQQAVRNSFEPIAVQYARLAAGRSLAFRAASSTNPLSPMRRSAHFSGSGPQSNYRRQKVGLRVSTVFTAVFALGVFGIGYGIYDLYSMFTTWPKELRSDLRSALRAKQQGDLQTSEKYFKRAYAKAIDLPEPPRTLGKDYLLKLTGISLAHGDVLESIDLPAAYSVYSTVLSDLKLGGTAESSTGSSIMTQKERLRAIGVALKLVEIGQKLPSIPDSEVEANLTWALEQTLKNVYSNQNSRSSQEEFIGPNEQDLQLSRFAEGVDVVSVLERAAQFYSERGNAEYAVPLYLHAISALLPADDASLKKTLLRSAPNPDDQCKAALLMNNLSSVFASPSVESQVNLPQALGWAQKALAVSRKASGDIPGAATNSKNECETTIAVVLFNLGMLNEMSKQGNKAKEYYQQALEKSRTIGMKEGVQQAKAALKRLEAA